MHASSAWFRKPVEMLSHIGSRLHWYVSWCRAWGTLPVHSWICGAEYFRKGDFRTAAEHYKKGLSRHPYHRAAACARLDYAYCLYRLGNLLAASQILSRLTAIPQPMKDAYLLLSKIYVALGRNASALSVMKRAIERFPNESTIIAHYAHVAVYSRASEPVIADARSRLETIRTETPLNDFRMTAIQAAIACLELKTGDPKRGEELLTRVIASGAAPFEAVLSRAEQLLEDGRIIPARALLSRAMVLASLDPRPVMLLAKSYMRTDVQSEPVFALQLAQSACQMSHWQNPDALNVMIDAYVANNDKDCAELMLGRLRRISSAQLLSLDQVRDLSEQISRLRTLKGSEA